MQLNDFGTVVEDRPEEGVFRVHPSAFSSEELFELEIKYIFERTWVFLTIDSQLPNPNDFVSTWIARTPVLVTRDSSGTVRAFLNVCRHKGAMLCPTARGNKRNHVCPYHGWAYDASGKNVHIKDRKDGHYSADFDAQEHDLVPLARVASYKGLIFGSLSSDVPPLEEFLGEFRYFLDLAMDQGPKGMEFVPGRSIYTYDGNWKFQMENGLDAYHLTSTHSSFMEVQGRRRSGAGNQAARQYDWQKSRLSQDGGMYQFRNGHCVVWLNVGEPEKRPISPNLGEIRQRLGDFPAEMLNKLRQTLVFPNMQIADSSSLILRVFRPISVNRTEMTTYCLAPIGESDEQRAWRIRQFEDFFNPSGLATPDDTVLYEGCQRGLGAAHMPMLQGHERGITATIPGANAMAKQAGFTPVASLDGSFNISSETYIHPAYREWARLMQTGIEGRAAYGEPA